MPSLLSTMPSVPDFLCKAKNPSPTARGESCVLLPHDATMPHSWEKLPVARPANKRMQKKGYDVR